MRRPSDFEEKNVPRSSSVMRYTHELHQITGAIAIFGYGPQLTREHLEDWGSRLKAVAAEMILQARQMGVATTPPKAEVITTGPQPKLKSKSRRKK